MIPNTIVIHHSASSSSTTPEEIDRWHKMRGFSRSNLGYYIGYHRLIFKNGNVLKTRNDNEIGCHVIPNNGKLGVCLIGNFENEKPTAAQLVSLAIVIDEWKIGFNILIDNIWGHDHFKATACPGKYLTDWINKYKKVGWLKIQIEKVRKLLAQIQNKREFYNG